MALFWDTENGSMGGFGRQGPYIAVSWGLVKFSEGLIRRFSGLIWSKGPVKAHIRPGKEAFGSLSGFIC